VRQVPWYEHSDWAAATLGAIERDPGNFARHWRGIPLLTKLMLREHGEALGVRSLPAAHLPLGGTRTSGSVGIPVSVRTTAVSRLAWDAQTVREHHWRERDFRLRLGAIRSLRREERQSHGHALRDWGPPVTRLQATGSAGAIHIGLDIGHLVTWLRRCDPHYLLTYPSFAAALLEELGQAGRPPSLREVRLMSEPLEPELEERLRGSWGVTVADVYSANEVGNIAYRCRLDSLHTLPETLLTEILDDDGRPCGPGETGRVVVTPFHNLGTVLIRYEIGDYATVGEPCACGRPQPVLARVMGRVRNMARSPAGAPFWPTSLVAIRRVAPIRQFQYVQTALDTIELRLVLDRPLEAGEEAAAIAQAQRALGHPFRVELRPVPAIERGPTGKFEEFQSRLAD
jgi:phenylacetate-CoA ligase